jgi:hypothetical protein
MYKDLCVKVEEDKEMELGLECRPATRTFSTHNRDISFSKDKLKKLEREHIYSLFVWLVADGWCWF